MYIGECGRRLGGERMIDHIGRDNKSHIAKHVAEATHPETSFDDFKIINNRFCKNYWKQKIAEALAIIS